MNYFNFGLNLLTSMEIQYSTSYLAYHPSILNLGLGSLCLPYQFWMLQTCLQIVSSIHSSCHFTYSGMSNYLDILSSIKYDHSSVHTPSSEQSFHQLRWVGIHSSWYNSADWYWMGCLNAAVQIHFNPYYLVYSHTWDLFTLLSSTLSAVRASGCAVFMIQQLSDQFTPSFPWSIPLVVGIAHIVIWSWSSCILLLSSVLLGPCFSSLPIL